MSITPVSLSGPLHLSRPAAAVPAEIRAFEAMVAGQFARALMPEDNGALCGEGPGAAVWRDMFADVLGEVIGAGGFLRIGGPMTDGLIPHDAGKQ